MSRLQNDGFAEIRLTNREMDMLVDMARGYSLRESSAARGIAVSTVKNRRTDVFRIFDVCSSGEAVREGYRHRILTSKHFDVDEEEEES